MAWLLYVSVSSRLESRAGRVKCKLAEIEDSGLSRKYGVSLISQLEKSFRALVGRDALLEEILYGS